MEPGRSADHWRAPDDCRASPTRHSTLRTLRRWRAAPLKRAVWWQIVLPLVGNAVVGLRFVVVGPPVILRAPLASIVFAMPDLGYTFVIAGAVVLCAEGGQTEDEIDSRVQRGLIFFHDHQKRKRE